MAAMFHFYLKQMIDGALKEPFQAAALGSSQQSEEPMTVCCDFLSTFQLNGLNPKFPATSVNAISNYTYQDLPSERPPILYGAPLRSRRAFQRHRRSSQRKMDRVRSGMGEP